jgi:hypothetical protein
VDTQGPKKGGKTVPFHPPTITKLLPTPTPFPTRAYSSVVWGTVRDARTHKPIAGATVTVANGQRSVKTDAQGRYRIGFPGGVYVPVTAKHVGYAESLAMGMMPPHKTFHKDFTLVRASKNHPAPPPVPGSFGSH